MALLEADVNFKVARAFVERIRERAVQTEVLEFADPGADHRLDRQRGADRPPRRRAAQAPLPAAAADGGDAARPAGQRQDHHRGQARPGDPQGGPPPADGRRRHVPAGRRTAAGAARQGQPDPGGHARRQGQATRAVQARRRRGEAAQLRRGHPRHRRAPADRPDHARRAQGDPAQGDRPRDPARRRRDDRPGGGQRRQGVRGGRRCRRGDPHQARRRRPRWRGAVDARVDRQAHPVHAASARRCRSSRRSRPTAWPRASSAWATSSR